MRLKVNPFQLACAVAMVLVHWLLPIAKVVLPVINISIIGLTMPMLGMVVGDWQVVPLVLAALMALAALVDSQPVSLAAGALGFVGMLALGLSLGAMVAGSDLLKLLQWAGTDMLKLPVDLGPMTQWVSTALLRLAIGFYVYLLLAALYVVLAVVQPGGQRAPRGPGGGGQGQRSTVIHRRAATARNDNEARRKALYK